MLKKRWWLISSSVLLLIVALYVFLVISSADDRRHTRKILSLSGQSTKNVLELLGKPRRIYTKPEDFKTGWKTLAEERVISPRSYPTSPGEVWLYPTRPDRWMNPCEKFWLIYFNKDNKVTKVMLTSGWW